MNSIHAKRQRCWSRISTKKKRIWRPVSVLAHAYFSLLKPGPTSSFLPSLSSWYGPGFSKKILCVSWPVTTALWPLRGAGKQQSLRDPQTVDRSGLTYKSAKRSLFLLSRTELSSLLRSRLAVESWTRKLSRFAPVANAPPSPWISSFYFPLFQAQHISS